jgi:hypothetical protein
MVCLRNISVDTLHKGDTNDNNNNKLLLVQSYQPYFALPNFHGHAAEFLGNLLTI